jgi:hypothetical protein
MPLIADFSHIVAGIDFLWRKQNSQGISGFQEPIILQHNINYGGENWISFLKDGYRGSL